MKKAILIFLIQLSILYAQGSQLPVRDTSFTVKNTALKVQAEYTSVSVVEPFSSLSVDEMTDQVYAANEFRNLKADVYLPSERTNKIFPGIILIHGGGWRSGDKSHLTPMAQKFAAEGYISANIEYTLSTEALYPASVHDIKKAVRWYKANHDRFNLDTNRIVLLGCSSGGHLAALAGVTYNDTKVRDNFNQIETSSRVQAIIDIDGLLDFTHELAAAERRIDNEKPASAFLWFGCTYNENPELWKEASPRYYVDKNTPPVLFINSARDRFHAGRDEMILEMNNFGIYSEVHTIPDTPHPFWLFHPWFDETCEYVLEFLSNQFK